MKSVMYETEFREVSRTRTTYSTETHTSDFILNTFSNGKPVQFFQQRFTTSFLQPLPFLVTPSGPENCVGAQTVVSLLQATQIKQGVSFIAANEVYTRK